MNDIIENKYDLFETILWEKGKGYFLLDLHLKRLKASAISEKILKSSDVYLKHKTTNRKLYNDEFVKCSLKGYSDVLFLNEKEELCEGAISNVFIQVGKKLYTPPLSCGLLPGVYREFLLKKNSEKYQEKKIYLKDIKKADAVYLTNSLRGIRKVDEMF